MEEKIIQYLKEKYNPTGIILIGSRATKDSRGKSDWDLFVFSDKTEGEVNDYSELKEFEGEALDVSIFPTKVDKDFILDTSMHPATDNRILYDVSGGLMQKIVANTKLAYEKGPTSLDERKKDLYRKILSKFIRKIEARMNQPASVLFGVGQFYHYCIRYWFETKKEWPQPLHKALPYIESHDRSFADLLEILHTTSNNTEQKLKAMYEIRDRLFPL